MALNLLGEVMGCSLLRKGEGKLEINNRRIKLFDVFGYYDGTLYKINESAGADSGDDWKTFADIGDPRSEIEDIFRLDGDPISAKIVEISAFMAVRMFLLGDLDIIDFAKAKYEGDVIESSIQMINACRILRISKNGYKLPETGAIYVDIATFNVEGALV